MDTEQGRIQDFKLGGAQLKKLCRTEGGVKIFRVFRVKNHDFTPKNHIFSNFRGHAPGAPPWIRPCRGLLNTFLFCLNISHKLYYNAICQHFSSCFVIKICHCFFILVNSTVLCFLCH